MPEPQILTTVNLDVSAAKNACSAVQMGRGPGDSAHAGPFVKKTENPYHMLYLH